MHTIEYKGYTIKPYAPSPSLYCVANAGRGGAVPAILEGAFTSTSIVKAVIDYYLLGKETKNGKARSES